MSIGAAGPNIVLSMVGQLSAKWFEAAVDGVCDMPNLRALLKRGTYFSRAVTSNPVCMAARATIATGLSTRGHGVLENGYSLSSGIPTFMRALQGNGYVTGALGKVHLRPHFETLYPSYRQYGFDVEHVTEDGRGGEWLDWVADTFPEHLDNVLATVWAPEIPEFGAYGPYRLNLREKIERARDQHTWATA